MDIGELIYNLRVVEFANRLCPSIALALEAAQLRQSIKLMIHDAQCAGETHET